MTDQQILYAWMQGEGITQKELADAIGMAAPFFRKSLFEAKNPVKLFEGLKKIGIEVRNGRVISTYERKVSEYATEWLNEAIRHLKGKGVIEFDKEISDATGYHPSNLVVFKKGIEPPSKNFVKVFLSVYGKDLADMGASIPVALSGGRKAEVKLPKGYSKQDIEMVVRVLMAYG